ncbi:MAG: prepilin-type N-terminal cleavage/methylation domain-containing protein [Alphaproteobacteria bacterium]|nr:prepilin-type N-terminal cleavage/methylation domain-containing protein [Alphaproteobacteria bacterium]
MKNFEIKNIDCRAALAMMKDSQNGRSMIEMLGVLAIIGVLSVGGIAGYSKAMQKYRINKTIEQITLISQNIRTFFANQRNYVDLNTLIPSGIKIIKKAKLVPDEVWSDDNLQNAFGGSFEMAVVSDAEYSGKMFTIAITDIPQEACIEIASNDWSVSSGLLGYAINTNSSAFLVSCFSDYPGTAACKNNSNKPMPMPINTAVSACSTSSNTLLFAYQ